MNKPTILLVEDSRSTAEEVRNSLEQRLGFKVLVAASRAEAEDLLDQHENELFLAILDLILPDAPGGEIVGVVRGRKVPAIVFTSRFDDPIRRHILAHDVIDYFIKNDHAVDTVTSAVDRLWRNRTAKLLIVDDSPSMRTFLKDELKRYMFQIYEASSGATALRLLERNPDISVVITDFLMPEMDGLELTRRIRHRFRREELAIVGVSVQSEMPLTVSFLKNGANDFITKPFQREELYCRVLQNVETVERSRALLDLHDIKNRFLGMAAHDLRNPINGIRGFSQMLIDGVLGTLTVEQHNVMRTIHDASADMLQLVNDLLDVSVIESGKLELDLAPASLQNMVEERLSFATLAAGVKNIRINTHFAPISLVLADVRRMAQVIDNLLSNATKYSPPDSEINVNIGVHDEQAVVSVRDSGPGILPDEQNQIFDSFQRLSARPTGGEPSTGLGLTIVRRIVMAHGGKVWIDSAPGQGSTFHVSLPFAIDGAPAC